jgi:hypothetical protein
VQLGGDLLQERVTALDGDRPGGAKDGVELGVGEADGRHGGRPFELAR